MADLHAWITLLVLSGVIGALIFTAWAPEAVMLGGVVALLVAGVLNADQAFGGFSNSGMLTVAAMFVVAAGLKETGAVQRVAGRLLGTGGTVHGALTRLVLPVAALSAFVNNTPIVAALMPATTEWARQNRVPVSKLLIPLSYAAILGGTCTLIGTSTNLVIAGLVAEALPSRPDLHALGLFEIAWVGVPVALAGVQYLIVMGARIPDRRPALSLDDDPREYTVELVVKPTSPLIGRSIEEAGLRHLPGLYIIELDRGDRILAAVGPDERLQAGDRLVFAGVLESVLDLKRLPGLEPADDQAFKLQGPRDQRCLVQAVVSRSNPLVGQTIRGGHFRTVYNAVVVAVARHGHRLNEALGNVELHEGDVLLLETHPDFVLSHRNRRDFYLVSALEDSTPLKHDRAPLAVGILTAVVGAATFGLLDMLEAALLGAAAMMLTRSCSLSEARRSVDWSVLIAIAAAFGLGEAMSASGLDVKLATGLVAVLPAHPTWAIAVFFVAGALLTSLLTNNAAAALLFPLCLTVADQLGVSPQPFIMTLIMAASACYATPIGYQTNLMVYGPGGYHFMDFVRFGLPLVLLVGAITVGLVPVIWPF